MSPAFALTSAPEFQIAIMSIVPNSYLMPNIYADRHLKRLVQRRTKALSDPDNGELVSETQALRDMLAPQYQREYERLSGDD